MHGPSIIIVVSFVSKHSNGQLPVANMTLHKLKHFAVISSIVSVVVILKFYVKSKLESDDSGHIASHHVSSDHVHTPPSDLGAMLPLLFAQNHSSPPVVTQVQFDQLMISRCNLLRTVCNQTAESNRKFYIRQFYVLPVNCFIVCSIMKSLFALSRVCLWCGVQSTSQCPQSGITTSCSWLARMSLRWSRS